MAAQSYQHLNASLNDFFQAQNTNRGNQSLHFVFIRLAKLFCALFVHKIVSCC